MGNTFLHPVCGTEGRKGVGLCHLQQLLLSSTACLQPWQLCRVIISRIGKSSVCYGALAGCKQQENLILCGLTVAAAVC